MDATIIAFLTQDGFISGAVYALLAVATVLVFTVARVIFVPQGDFVAFAALTMAALQSGKAPGTVWLLAILAGVAMVMEVWTCLRANDADRAMRAVLVYGIAPGILGALVVALAPMQLPLLVQALVTLVLVTALARIFHEQ